MKRAGLWFLVVCFYIIISLPSAAQIISVKPAQMVSPTVGTKLSIDIVITDAFDILAFELDLAYDPTALRFVRATESDFLKTGCQAFMIPPIVYKLNPKDGGAGTVKISAACLGGISTSGDGVLTSVEFEVVAVKSSALEFKGVRFSNSEPQIIFPRTIKGATITAKKLEPAIREHQEESPILALEAKFPKDNIFSKCYIDIWRGEFVIETEQYLEYQIAMFSGNPSYNAGIDLHTTDEILLSAMNAEDEAGLNASPKTDLSVPIQLGAQNIKHAARDRWYHRKISLNALIGKTVNSIMLATISEIHKAGIFRMYVDNIRITDGTNRVLDVYIDNDTILDGKEEATEGQFVKSEGVMDCKVTGVTSVSVNPLGNLSITWGKIKGSR